MSLNGPSPHQGHTRRKAPRRRGPENLAWNAGGGRLLIVGIVGDDHFLNCSSISTWYPVTILLVSLAMPTTAISSLNMGSVMPFFCADTVCEAMQYPHWLVTLTAI